MSQQERVSSSTTDSQKCLICTACGAPCKLVLTRHGPHSIRLLRCGVCGDWCDSVLEFDLTLVLLDVLLLKPRVFRHLIHANRTLRCDALAATALVFFLRLLLVGVICEMYVMLQCGPAVTSWAARGHHEHSREQVSWSLASLNMVQRVAATMVLCTARHVADAAALAAIAWSAVRWAPSQPLPPTATVLQRAAQGSLLSAAFLCLAALAVAAAGSPHPACLLAVQIALVSVHLRVIHAMGGGGAVIVAAVVLWNLARMLSVGYVTGILQ
eukprot:m.32429 g.32429  ORF g.32429 m.32429 type:complete len:270 (+) comp10031_c0_seq2:74-883(+)